MCGCEKVLPIIYYCFLLDQLSDACGDIDSQGSQDNAQLELAFEYLIAKDTMQWINIFSDQVITYTKNPWNIIDYSII